ncbi:hypothetical protein GYB29_14025 [bacterium]|nr:hypothetical protein [bacterium]
MQKFLIVFLLIGISSEFSYAQQNRFGMKSGVALSSMSHQQTEIGAANIEWGGKSSYQTGVFYNRRLKNSLLSFQIEVDYKKLGTVFRINDIDPRVSSSAKANYEFEHVGFSILPRIDLFPDYKINPNFMIGGIM